MIPFWTLLQREIHRFLKVTVQTVITPLVSSLLYLLIFGISLGGNIHLTGGLDYLAFLIPGLVMMGLMNNAFQNSSSSIVAAKFTGELEDLKVVPLSNSEIIWAVSFGSVVRGAVVGFVTFAVGFVFYYFRTGNWLGIAHPFELFYFVVMVGLVFGKLGLSTAFWARSVDQLTMISSFVLLPLTYLGGVFLSIDHLHPIWQTLCKLNPLFYFVNGMRYSILGVSDVSVEMSCLVVLFSLFVFHGLAHWSLRRGSFSRW